MTLLLLLVDLLMVLLLVDFVLVSLIFLLTFDWLGFVLKVQSGCQKRKPGSQLLPGFLSQPQALPKYFLSAFLVDTVPTPPILDLKKNDFW